jgi:hypothetical protein
VVGRRRRRAAEIERARLAMAAKRGGRWVKRCFKAIEGQLVTAAVARLEMVISIKVRSGGHLPVGHVDVRL